MFKVPTSWDKEKEVGRGVSEWREKGRTDGHLHRLRRFTYLGLE